MEAAYWAKCRNYDQNGEAEQLPILILEDARGRTEPERKGGGRIGEEQAPGCSISMMISRE
jgi:hypothetical protein